MSTVSPTLPTEGAQHTWIYRTTVQPVMSALRLGASPERLAWSLAIGLVVGVNPVLGSTTVACLAIACLLRLNLLASQVTNHLVYPLQLMLLLPFLRLGRHVFGTPPIPLSSTQLVHLARTHPIDLSRRLWLWESHALLAWLVVALVVAPLLAAALLPVMRRLQARCHREQRMAAGAGVAEA